MEARSTIRAISHLCFSWRQCHRGDVGRGSYERWEAGTVDGAECGAKSGRKRGFSEESRRTRCRSRITFVGIPRIPNLNQSSPPACENRSSGRINYWSGQSGPGVEHRLPERLASPPPTVAFTLSFFPCFSPILCSFLPHDSSSPFAGSFHFLSLTLTPSPLSLLLISRVPLVLGPRSSWSNFLFRPLNWTP